MISWTSRRHNNFFHRRIGGFSPQSFIRTTVRLACLVEWMWQYVSDGVTVSSFIAFSLPSFCLALFSHERISKCCEDFIQHHLATNQCKNTSQVFFSHWITRQSGSFRNHRHSRHKTVKCQQQIFTQTPQCTLKYAARCLAPPNETYVTLRACCGRFRDKQTIRI